MNSCTVGRYTLQSLYVSFQNKISSYLKMMGSVIHVYVNLFQTRLQNCEKRLLAFSCLSVRPPAWNNSAPTGRISIKFDILAFSENLSRKRFIQIRQEQLVPYTKTFSYLCQYLAAFFVKLKVFRIKAVGKIETHILCSVNFSENLGVHQKMSKNMVETGCRQYGGRALNSR